MSNTFSDNKEYQIKRELTAAASSVPAASQQPRSTSSSPSRRSSLLSGSLLLSRVSLVLPPGGSQQLLAPWLLLLLLFLLLRLSLPDGVQLLQWLCLRARPLPALQPAGHFLPSPLLVRPAGQLLCTRTIRTRLQPHRLSICLPRRGQLFQEGLADELRDVLQCAMMRRSTACSRPLSVHSVHFSFQCVLLFLFIVKMRNELNGCKGWYFFYQLLVFPT